MIPHELLIGGKCRSGRHVIGTAADIYVEPSTGYKRCVRCFRRNRIRAQNAARKLRLIEPDIEVVPLAQVPPSAAARVEPGTWDSLIRRARLLAAREALRVTGVDAGCRLSLLDAAERGGLAVEAVWRRGAIWVTRREGR